MSKPAISRSVLYMPVSERRFVESAWRRSSDGLILDLEDSVPAYLKAYARGLVKESIPLARGGGASVLVRVNIESVREDLEASVWPGLDMIVLPKAESGEQVAQLADWLDELESRRGLERGRIGIWPLIETAVGVSHAYEIADSSERVWWYGGGQGYDMSLELEVDMFVGFDQFEYGQGEAELATRALGLEPVNCLFFPDTSGTVSDPTSALEHGRALKQCGFRVATAFHPAAVAGLNEGLTPSAEELVEARAVIQRADSQGHGSPISADGRILDEYELRRARDLVGWAEACRKMDVRKSAARQRTRELRHQLAEAVDAD